MICQDAEDRFLELILAGSTLRGRDRLFEHLGLCVECSKKLSTLRVEHVEFCRKGKRGPLLTAHLSKHLKERGHLLEGRRLANSERSTKFTT